MTFKSGEISHLFSLTLVRRALFVGVALFGLGIGACDSKSVGDEQCKIGETKEVDCNTCTCELGQWACTETACEQYDPCLGSSCGDACTVCDPNDKDCVETAELKACDAKGQCVSDTPDLVCDAECKDGDKKMVDCNSCSCDAGAWTCTEVACDEPDPCMGKLCGDICSDCDPTLGCDEDQELKQCDAKGQCVDLTAKQICEPECKDGDTKMVDCNICGCAAGEWSCTAEACDDYDPCQGKSCGDACTVCDPDDLGCDESGELKACDPKGVCVAVVADLCEAPYEPCAGKACGDLCSTCDPNDKDCVDDPAVMACDPKGVCVLDSDDLCVAPYEPCADKVCGDPCTSCDPNDKDCVENPVVKACDATAQCVADTKDLCL